MMKTRKRSIQFFVFFMTLLWSASAALGATSAPSNVNAAYGQSTSVTIHYTLSSPLASPVTSTQGTFIFNDAIIGYVHTPITTTFQASEVLTIPQSIVERVFRKGGNTFLYRRSFAGTFLDPANVIIRIVPGSAAAFSVRRIELYFDNVRKKNEEMVPRNFKGLKACADVYYNGSGFLNGYWKVDDRIIGQVNRFVPAGGKITLATPRIPDLPTFEPGYHIVKFVVTSPEMPFEVPEIVYWVKGTEAPAKKTLALIKPRDGMDIPPDSLFEWGKMEKASLYLISFIQAGDKKIRFSALTRKNTYRIPPTVLTEYLAPGKKYLWSVKGYDTGNNVIAESALQSIYLKPPSSP